MKVYILTNIDRESKNKTYSHAILVRNVNMVCKWLNQGLGQVTNPSLTYNAHYNPLIKPIVFQEDNDLM